MTYTNNWTSFELQPWLFLSAVPSLMAVSTAIHSTVSNREFYIRRNPTYGPVRLSSGWKARSLLSCMSACLQRFSNCWTVMFNSNTHRCTPGKWVSRKEPAPSQAEGKLYASYTCDLTFNFTVYEVSNSLICAAYFQGPAYKKNYTDAVRDCQSFGGDLFSPKDPEKFFLLPEIIAGVAWIGLDDIAKEDQFVWRGDRTVLEDWHRTNIFDLGEPNNENGIEDCVLVSSSSLRASDYPCNKALDYVCEKPFA